MWVEVKFIYSFRDGSIKNTILSWVKDENYVLWHAHDKDRLSPRFENDEFRMRQKYQTLYKIDKKIIAWILFLISMKNQSKQLMMDGF